jgi:hypothetical protein
MTVFKRILALGLIQQSVTLKALVQSQVWDLCWTEWYLVQVFLQMLVFPCQYHRCLGKWWELYNLHECCNTHSLCFDTVCESKEQLPEEATY